MCLQKYVVLLHLESCGIGSHEPRSSYYSRGRLKRLRLQDTEPGSPNPHWMICSLYTIQTLSPYSCPTLQLLFSLIHFTYHLSSYHQNTYLSTYYYPLGFLPIFQTVHLSYPSSFSPSPLPSSPATPTSKTLKFWWNGIVQLKKL